MLCTLFIGNFTLGNIQNLAYSLTVSMCFVVGDRKKKYKGFIYSHKPEEREKKIQ